MPARWNAPPDVSDMTLAPSGLVLFENWAPALFCVWAHAAQPGSRRTSDVEGVDDADGACGASVGGMRCS